MAREIIAECECSVGPVVLTKFFTYREAGVFKYHKGRCPNCDTMLKVEKVETGFDARPPSLHGLAVKRKHRDRPEVVPSDLAQKLAEEQRLRAERNNDGEMVGSTEEASTS